MGFPGLLVQTQSLLLNGNINMCQEGMSPLMERFTLNKQKAAQNHKQPTGESEYKKYNARK